MTDKQLAKLHEQIPAKDDIKSAIIYSVRNWLAYRMFPPGDTNIYLERAYHGAMAAHRRNEPHVRLFTMAIFMAIESGHADTAANMLDKAMEYRSFLKANEPYSYGVFCFLRAYLAIRRQRSRAAKKYRKIFTTHINAVGYSPHYDVMLGQLHLAALEYEDAYSYLTRAYDEGLCNVYLYEGLYRCYRETSNNNGQFPNIVGPELLPLLIYAAKRGADISTIASTHENALFSAISNDSISGERLYEISGYPPLLKPLCINKMRNGDYGPDAYNLYSKAAIKQIDIDGLAAFLVQSSYANRIEDINSYLLAQFLANSRDATIELGLAAYAYHLLLTDPVHRSILKSHDKIIMQTAARCLEKNITGREANSLYQFYLRRCKTKGITGELIRRAETILHSGLTQFELLPGRWRYVYIAQPERRGMDEYEFTNEGERQIINAAHDNFQYVCLGAGRRVIVDEPLTVKRVVPLADQPLYQYFFDKGDRRFHVLAYLAAYYLESKEAGSADDMLGSAISVFEAMLTEKTLHKPYRMRVLAALGHLYCQSGNHTKALRCYAEIDIDSLAPECIRQILQVYLQTKEYAQAAKLIARRRKSIPAPVLYEGLCQLMLQPHVDNAGSLPLLAEAAYDLLLSGYNSETLLSAVLTHHRAGQSEWKALASALETSDPRLDVHILSADIWMACCDAFTQKAFRRLHTAKKAPKECAQFIEFCKFGMLTQNFVPEYEIINILEKIYLNQSPADNYLLLALCYVYLRHGITTFRSDKIIRHGIDAQEAAGILLPIFKENKPYPHPYLEKYQPFLYQTAPGKDIRLNYRIDDEPNFLAEPMQYLRYGMYVTKIPLFFNETVTYYYSEEMPTGSITTHETSHKNTTPYLCDNHPDAYFTINNALIYEQMFRHEKVESIIDGLVKDVVEVQGRLL